MGIDYQIRGKDASRATHWNEIRSRVTTHEGETLSGKAGQDYLNLFLNTS